MNEYAPNFRCHAHVSNGLPYVSEAIESIPIESDISGLELLVVDDSSTDGSPEVVRGFAAKDSRIKLIPNNSGTKGEGPARNVGIDNAKGEYVAMMDADDISLPNRLEVQVAFMDKHSDVALSGCWAQCFGTRNNNIQWSPSRNWVIKAVLCFFSEPWGTNHYFSQGSDTREVCADRCWRRYPIHYENMLTPSGRKYSKSSL